MDWLLEKHLWFVMERENHFLITYVSEIPPIKMKLEMVIER
jgi:hypothetical protein